MAGLAGLADCWTWWFGVPSKYLCFHQGLVPPTGGIKDTVEQGLGGLEAPLWHPWGTILAAWVTILVIQGSPGHLTGHLGVETWIFIDFWWIWGSSWDPIWDQSPQDPMAACAENIVNTQVFVRFHSICSFTILVSPGRVWDLLFGPFWAPWGAF